jgi:hypothetical protein
MPRSIGLIYDRSLSEHSVQAVERYAQNAFATPCGIRK